MRSFAERADAALVKPDGSPNYGGVITVSENDMDAAIAHMWCRGPNPRPRVTGWWTATALEDFGWPEGYVCRKWDACTDNSFMVPVALMPFGRGVRW